MLYLIKYLITMEEYLFVLIDNSGNGENRHLSFKFSINSFVDIDKVLGESMELSISHSD